MSTQSKSTDKLKTLLEAAVKMFEQSPGKLTNLKSVELDWEVHDTSDGDVAILPTIKVAFK